MSSKLSNKTPSKVIDRLSRPKSDAPPASPLKNPRPSIDRSPRSNLIPKPTPLDRRSPKLTTPDKQQPRVPKGSELQAQLSLIQEDLNNTKAKLILLEKEKAQAIDELRDAQKSADEANEKLREAQAAQKQAEENSEIEKFRAVEMEQAAIESTQKKEEEWQKDLEAVRNQHDFDAAALHSATQELQKLKDQLTTNLDAKNEAINRADDVTKIAETHAQNIVSLSAEVASLKALLDSTVGNEADDSTRLLSELNQEIDTLKKELEKAKAHEQELVEKDTCLEQLKVELEEARLSAHKSMEEWQKKVKDLEARDGESTQIVSELDQEIRNLKEEVEKAKSYEHKLVEKEACLETLKNELEAANLATSSARKSMEEWEKKVTDLEARDGESTQMVSELDLEIHILKEELEKAKSYEHKLMEKEACIEKLNAELEAAKLAKSSARKSMEEWQKKVKDLEAKAEESNWLERSASESLDSIMKQLEESNDSLHDAESEIISLREKIGLLEISITRQRGELEESERQLLVAKEKAVEMTKKAESIGYELENMEEEKSQALNNEKLAAESVQTLLEEKNKLINELETLRGEEQKNKKEIESLEKALKEVTLEAREAKERISSSSTEQENYENQIENMRLVLNATNEKYQTMLDEAKHENDMLIDTIEENKQGYQNSITEWEQKEIDMMNSLKKSEDDNSSLQREISELKNLLKEAEEDAAGPRNSEEETRLKISLEESKSEVAYLKEVIGETKAESMKLKESILDKENELQSVIDENNELLQREVSLVEKIEELTQSLDEAATQKQVINGDELSENEDGYELPTKVVECYEQNGHGSRDEESLEMEMPPQQCEPTLEDKDVNVDKVGENLNGNVKEEETKETDVKMWEMLNIGTKDLLPDEKKEHESVEEELLDLDTKVNGGESLEEANGFLISSAETDENGGSSSPSKQNQIKKKKPLFQKFGGLLKKKSSNNHK